MIIKSAIHVIQSAAAGISEAYENVWEPVKHAYLSSVVDYKFELENFDTDFSSEDNVRKWIRRNPPAFCNNSDSRFYTNPGGF